MVQTIQPLAAFWVGVSYYSSGALSGAGRSGSRTPVVARFSGPIETGPEVHTASCKTGTGSVCQVRPRRGVGYPPPTSAVVEYGQSYTSYLLLSTSYLPSSSALLRCNATAFITTTTTTTTTSSSSSSSSTSSSSNCSHWFVPLLLVVVVIVTVVVTVISTDNICTTEYRQIYMITDDFCLVECDVM